MPISVVGALNPSVLVKHTLLWQAIGIVLMVSHVLLTRQSVAFYPLMMLLGGWIYFYAPLAGLLVFFQVLLYQNMIISIFSVDMSYQTFTALQGSNFVLLAVMALIATGRLLPIWREYKAIAVTIGLAILIALLYCAVGAAKAGTTSALVYFREFIGPVLAAVVGIDVGRTWGYRTVGVCFLYSAFPSLMLSLVEYFNPIDYYSAIGEVRYMQLKYTMQTAHNTFYTPLDIVNQYTSAFFNLTGGRTGGFDNFRYGGTIINPISNAYILAVVGLIAVSLKRSIWLLLIVPMMIMIGVKGASILLVSSLLMYFVWVNVHNRKVITIFGILVAVAYISSGIIIGMRNNDFHVLGFLGGWHSLMSTPIGHGIGVGGNLSSRADAGFHWTGAGGFSSAGADFAVESAVGVLIYQMGIAALAIFGVFGILLYKAPLGLTQHHVMPYRSDIVFFGLAMVALNGVFQEEAYAPYAAGLIMLFCGVLMANRRRVGVVLPSTVPRREKYVWI